MSLPVKLGKIIMLLIVWSVASWAGEWINTTPLSIPRAGAASVVWQGKIYVFGGKSINNRVLNTVEVYDPVIEQWDTTRVPHFDKGRYNTAAVVFKNKIYLIGGRNEGDVIDDVEVYDPVQNLWSEAQELHMEREGHTAAVLNGRIYVFGGQNEDHYVVGKVEWYDVNKNKWMEEKNGMQQPRVAPLALEINNLLYMFGGYYFGLTRTFYTAQLQSGNLKWVKGADLPQPRAYGVAILKQDSVFLIGGEISDGVTDKVTVYDLNRKTYVQEASLNTPRSGLTGVCLHDTLFAIGGYSQNNVPLNTVEMYVPISTGIPQSKKSGLPQSTVLISGYPNPFNGAISLQISVRRVDFYTIALYNALGKKIKTIYNGILTNGRHRFGWQGKDETGNDAGSGIYFLQVRSAHASASYKMVYIK